jgi:hypothetical protein
MSAPELSAAPEDRRAFARRVALWLLPFAALCATLAVWLPDSYQQDGGYHFLGARWALEHPRFLVEVWYRPLFTALYALPARLGYPAAKLLTVAIALAAGWHAAALAREHGLKRPELAVPLLFLQPSFLLLSSETMTEPLFALVLAIALRLHRAGRVRSGMAVASLLPLARPEGFFVGILWGAFVLLDRRAGRTLLARVASTLLLASGTAAWSLAALAVTGDPLFVLHDWPKGWGIAATNGTGPLLHYWDIRYEILGGPLPVALFALGTAALLAARRATLALASALLVAGLHAVFFRYRLFGSAGYARYLVCVSVPIALLTLEGWNVAAAWLGRAPAAAAWLAGRLLPSRPGLGGRTGAALASAVRPVGVALGVLVLGAALVRSAWYVEGMPWSRDARAVRETYEWFLAHPRPVNQLVFSQAYMPILLGRDPGERRELRGDPAMEVEALRSMPTGTLVFWDAHTGPLFYKLGPAELEQAGYSQIYAREFPLPPSLPGHEPWAGEYRQEYYLYYK